MDTGALVLQLRYSVWATRRVLESITPLSPEELHLALGNSYGGVHGTLTHIYQADAIRNTGINASGNLANQRLASADVYLNFPQSELAELVVEATGYLNGNGTGNANTGNPFVFRDNQYVANSNLSWMKGRHDLRFGLEYYHSGINHFQPQGGTFGTPRGTFGFDGSVTALNSGPAANAYNSFAQFLLGFRRGTAKSFRT